MNNNYCMVITKGQFYAATMIVGIVFALLANIALDAGCELQGVVTWSGKQCI